MTSTRALLRVLTLFNTYRFCLRNACRLGTPSDLHVQALATTMKRAAASDHEFHGTPQAKRPASLPVDSFINALSTAGDKEYGDWLNFRVGYTVTKGHQLIIDSKVWHLHPPAGSTSRTRLLVNEDASRIRVCIVTSRYKINYLRTSFARVLVTLLSRESP